MRYLIEYPYCGNTYTIQAEHNKSFSCPGCGARNGEENILQKQNDKAELQRAVNEYLEKQRKEDEHRAEQEKNVHFMNPKVDSISPPIQIRWKLLLIIVLRETISLLKP